MKRVVLLIFVALACSFNAFSQCAMCRSTLENNISNGNVGIAAGINTGILYLLSLPYLAVMVLGYLWYHNSKRNATKFHSRPA
ncbi:MAG: hypothetical protein ACK4RF_08670 [Cyclobacteriaceae bacterium]